MPVAPRPPTPVAACRLLHLAARLLIAIAAAMALPALALAQTYTLTVAIQGGSGNIGTITSNPSGITCPATACTAPFSAGTQVVLTAAGIPGTTTFAGWVSGPCTGSVPTCTVTMSQAQSVTAAFDYVLTVVSQGGSGTGTVTDSTGAITCVTSTCSASYAAGTQVVLTAAASGTSTFAGWLSGPCAGSTALACTVTMNQAYNATAAFVPPPAVFSLQDKTGLTPGTYQIYVTGFSTAGPYVLQPDGSWGAPAVPSPAGAKATLPCYRFPQDLTQVQISGMQYTISARVYYFIVTDTARFPSCNPASGTVGLFNQQGAANVFTYTNASTLNLVTPTVDMATTTVFPAWMYSEIGASTFTGTIDLSQVDFVAFPMNTVATVSAAAVGAPANPTTIGNPLGVTANPGDVVNHLSIRDSYAEFVHGLADAVGGAGACASGTPPAVCAYLELKQNLTTSGSPVPQYVIQNPGGYLGQNTSATQASLLNTWFDGVIAQLWAGTNAPTLQIDSGGIINGVPEDTFTSTVVPMNFPGSSYQVNAMKFTGNATGYVAYVFSPSGYQAGCNGGQIPAKYCSTPASTGFQVFAGAGTLNTPLKHAEQYAALIAANQLPAATTQYGADAYGAVVARLGLLISGAMNRGVALVNCDRTYTWQCWQDETYWYPTQAATGPAPSFPDITQNVFSQWMHMAKIGGTPMFVRPPSAVKSATSTPGTGRVMGMAYGFAVDENPTPPVNPASPQPEAPSKMDSTVVYNGAGPYTITFGPWVTSAANPTLVVDILDPNGGTVTSSPAGIECEPTCSQSFAPGTQVTLTAKPAKSYVFGKWSGACSGRSTTCTVTINATTTVKAEFWEILAGAPSSHGLHVTVSGTGMVTSQPAGISCGDECSRAFAGGSQVVLTATAAPGASFAGWSGACSGTGITCTVAMSQARSVGAAFAGSGQFTLTVTGGTGGIVTTTPGGIDCGTRCVAGFAAGTPVSVIARPQAGYAFSGWSGACSGSATCDLVLNGDRSVTATFAVIPSGQVALTVHDYGEGSIVSFPAGINCGPACSASFATGTEVTLTPIPKSGHRFVGWTGACTGAGACVVWMGDREFVTAQFAADANFVVEPIPTLSEWALLLMTLLIALAAYRPLTAAARGPQRR
jgi:hypothetical protein